MFWSFEVDFLLQCGPQAFYDHRAGASDMSNHLSQDSKDTVPSFIKS